MSLNFTKTKFIAEVCSNHNGNLNRALKFVDFAKEHGFYAVKFQMFKIDKLFSKDAKRLFKIAKKKRKRELPKNFIPKIYEYCKKKKLNFHVHLLISLQSLILKNMLIFIKSHHMKCLGLCSLKNALEAINQ